MHDAICVTIEFLLIFGEINFMQLLKICEIHKIYGPQNKSALQYDVEPIWLVKQVLQLLYGSCSQYH